LALSILSRRGALISQPLRGKRCMSLRARAAAQSTGEPRNFAEEKASNKFMARRATPHEVRMRWRFAMAICSAWYYSVTETWSGNNNSDELV